MADISQIKLPNNTTYDLKDSKKTGIYYVKGTQTKTTGAWTGNIDVPALYTGLTIMYYLPYDGSGNATLNLTLSDGTTTGAKNCYVTTGRLTTHYGAGRNIIMTYYKAGDISIKGTTTTDDRWICDAFYDSNDTTTLHSYYSRPTVDTNGIKQYSLFAYTSSLKVSSFTTNNGTGTKTFNTTNYFDIRKIFYYNGSGNVAAGAKLGNNTMSLNENLVDMRYTFNGVTTSASTSSLVAEKPVFICFDLSDMISSNFANTSCLAKLKSPYITQEMNDMSTLYVLVGYMHDSYRCSLIMDNLTYAYGPAGFNCFTTSDASNMAVSAIYSSKVNGHTVEKDVPSDAVFTDTKVTSSTNHYTPATASGQDKTASASGATAAWSIDVVKGVTLNTDGKGHVTGLSVTSGKIPANPNTDTKVRQTLSTANKNYPLLMSYAESSNTTGNVDNVSYRANTIYANPSTGNLQATQLNGVTIGSSPKFTDHTYSGTGLISVNSSGVISTTATANTGTITSVKTTAGAHTTINVTSGAANFNVPTKTSHLTNDSGFVTSDTKVNQNLDASNQNRPLIMAGTTISDTNSSVNSTVARNNNIYANPYTGDIYVGASNGITNDNKLITGADFHNNYDTDNDTDTLYHMIYKEQNVDTLYETVLADATHKKMCYNPGYQNLMAGMFNGVKIVGWEAVNTIKWIDIMFPYDISDRSFTGIIILRTSFWAFRAGKDGNGGFIKDYYKIGVTNSGDSSTMGVETGSGTESQLGHISYVRYKLNPNASSPFQWTGAKVIFLNVYGYLSDMKNVHARFITKDGDIHTDYDNWYTVNQ
jgi:hypothetical protein